MARWALIAGPKKSNKTSQALKLIELLRAHGVAVGGFFQDRREDDAGFKHYDLIRIKTGERVTVASQQKRTSNQEDLTACAIRFDRPVFAIAKAWLEADAESASVLFVGDLSKEEVAGIGHYPAARFALDLDDDKIVVLSVRTDQLFDIVHRFELDDDALAALELPASNRATEQFHAKVLESAELLREGIDS